MAESDFLDFIHHLKRAPVTHTHTPMENTDDQVQLISSMARSHADADRRKSENKARMVFIYDIT